VDPFLSISGSPKEARRVNRLPIGAESRVWPNAHYVLVSTRHHGAQTGLAGDDVEFRSFRIVDGEVSEEEVEVVESYLFGHSPTTVVYD